jgi:hypothetical protein
MVTLSVYTLDEAEASDFNTRWVFAKMWVFLDKDKSL